MDGLLLSPAEPAVGGMAMLAFALLLVVGVIGAMIGHWAAENER